MSVVFGTVNIKTCALSTDSVGSECDLSVKSAELTLNTRVTPLTVKSIVMENATMSTSVFPRARTRMSLRDSTITVRSVPEQQSRPVIKVLCDTDLINTNITYSADNSLLTADFVIDEEAQSVNSFTAKGIRSIHTLEGGCQNLELAACANLGTINVNNATSVIISTCNSLSRVTTNACNDVRLRHLTSLENLSTPRTKSLSIAFCNTATITSFEDLPNNIILDNISFQPDEPNPLLNAFRGVSHRYETITLRRVTGIINLRTVANNITVISCNDLAFLGIHVAHLDDDNTNSVTIAGCVRLSAVSFRNFTKVAITGCPNLVYAANENFSTAYPESSMLDSMYVTDCKKLRICEIPQSATMLVVEGCKKLEQKRFALKPFGIRSYTRFKNVAGISITTHKEQVGDEPNDIIQQESTDVVDLSGDHSAANTKVNQSCTTVYTI
jgi:hypothetical protein